MSGLLQGDPGSGNNQKIICILKHKDKASRPMLATGRYMHAYDRHEFCSASLPDFEWSTLLTMIAQVVQL
jgi:hypothetical protein